MVTSTLAAADLFNTIPNLFEAFKGPAALVLIATGIVSAILSLHKGVGSAVGKMLGGIALAALALGGVGMTMSVQKTVNDHGNGVLVGQYGQ